MMAEDAWRSAIKAAIAARNTNMKAVSKAAGLGETYVRDMLLRSRAPGPEALVKICDVLGLDPAVILRTIAGGDAADGTVPVGPITTLPVRYRVQAGTWMELDDLAQTPLSRAPISPRPDIPLSDQWAELVVGDSFDRFYPEGTILHVRSGWAFDPSVRRNPPARVIVARNRAGGLLIERTVKEVVVTPSGDVELWPRSHNPKWSKPVPLNGGTQPGEELTVEIVGLVIGAYLQA